jgi:mono/diheme cytochrome c family protein
MSAPTSQPETNEPYVAGLLAEFDGPDSLKSAAARVRDAGFRRWDVHSPYPIHGMERAMGVRPTRLPWIVLAAGLTGAAVALLLQGWTNAVDYPLNVSGKPLFSLPAFIPITFELTVLLAALAAFGGALVFNLLPQFWHPAFGSERFKRVTRDAFFITIDAADEKFDEAACQSLLREAGATAVETLFDSKQQQRVPTSVWMTGVTLAILAVVPPLLIAAYRASPKPHPRIHVIYDMDFQEKYLPQAASPLFADNRAMRPPLEGTVGVGELDDDDHFYRGLVDGEPAASFPMQVTMPLMQRGRERFNVYCSACHGRAGEGGITGIVSARAIKRQDATWVMPLSLHADSVVDQPNGMIFETITLGRRTMPSYAAQIPPGDRWAIVAYVRALQRSQHASPDDVPESIRPLLK